MDDNLFDQLVVVKRSGQRVDFDAPKIAVVIKNAFDTREDKYSESDINKVYLDVLNYIQDKYQSRKTINVEDIQNIIENKLQEDNYIDIYISFKEYRDKRAKSRQAFSMKQEHKLVKAVEKISNYVFSKEDNDFNSSEVITNFGETISEQIVKIYLLDNKYVKAHEEGKIFIHDMKFLSTGMFSSINPIISEEYKKNNLFELLNLLLNVKKETYGEIGLNAIDYLLAPWIIINFKITLKKRIIKYLNIKGILEYVNLKKLTDLIDNLNTIDVDLKIFQEFSLNNQTDDLFLLAINDSKEEVYKMLKSCLKIILIELNNSNSKYNISFGTNKSHSGKLINNSLVEIISELKPLENVTLIYKVDKICNEELLEKIFSCLKENKNIVFSFINTSYNKNGNIEIEYFSNGNRIFENKILNEKSSNGRMIITTTSINLARLAIKNRNKPKKAFYKELDEILELTKNQLILIFDSLCNKNKKNYQFLFKNNLLDDEKLLDSQKIRKVIKNGILNIGLVGIKEAAYCLDKNNSLDTTKEIVKYINKKCNKFIKETKLNFAISETYDQYILEELMRLDKTVYGIIDGITDKDSYSTIDKEKFSKDLLEKLNYYGDIQKLLTGGSKLEIYISEENDEYLKKIIDSAIKSDIGFLKIKIGKSI